MPIRTDLSEGWTLPCLDRNEQAVDWVGRVPWVYERSLRHTVVAGEEVVLAFEGLDTIATITLNDQVVARTENMHRRYEVPVGGALRDGENRLAVRFDSAWDFGEEQRGRLGPLPNQYPGPFNYLRKMACNFGWDWGPALVTAGIWRPVHLVRTTSARLRSVRPTTTVDGLATFAVTVDGRWAGLRVEARVGAAVASFPVTAAEQTVEVRVDRPRLWWPHGLGEPARYDASVRLLSDEDGVVDEWAARLGFRSIRLDTTPDAEGTPFALVVNDVPVPVRGANWIPDDCFPSRVTPERLGERIGQAVDANINLLRVWGGGVYESHDFYSTCDERGVLVWQDFLFACAAYPEDERLAREIDAEARDNVARLIWGWFDWDWQRVAGDRPWGLRYYLEVLLAAVAEVDPSRREAWTDTVTVRRLSFSGAELATFAVPLRVEPLGPMAVTLPAAVATPATPTAELIVAGSTVESTVDSRAVWFFAEDRG